jgi:hypothetical protein
MATERWRQIVRSAAIAAIRLSPLIWLAQLIPLALDDAWSYRNVVLSLVLAVATLPLMFLVAVVAQILPREWYR